MTAIRWNRFLVFATCAWLAWAVYCFANPPVRIDQEGRPRISEGK